jgi:hypothetical protein
VELGEYEPMYGESVIKITVPKAAWEASRSYVRVWIGSSEGVSNEVLVPLAAGRVIFDMAKFRDRKDPRTMVMYNPMIDRFVDGKKENNKPLNRPDVDPKVDFYGGDVVGITKKIEEGFFSELGVNSLWISPVVRNPEGPYGQWIKTPATKFSGYHGYWPVALLHRSRTQTAHPNRPQIRHQHFLGLCGTPHPPRTPLIQTVPFMVYPFVFARWLKKYRALG